MADRRRILGPDGRPIPRGGTSPRDYNIKSRYDSAQSTAENARHWSETDSFSARAANNTRVRWVLRNRSRYESANNCYARGMVLTLANDLIGSGPRLQMLTTSPDVNQRIEAAFTAWAKKVKLGKKLRTMRQAKIVDGEAFMFFDSDPKLGPVQLDLHLYEADQVATPFPYPLDPRAVDGIRFDAHMKPREYHLLRMHPGDDIQFGFPYEYDSVPARFVIHWYREDRPGQYRGVPEITPALPLFAQLRRYSLAVLTAAEIAAEYSAVLQSDLPPDGDEDPADDDSQPMEAFQVERGMMATLPAGWKMNQFRPEQPTTTYAMFKQEILDEAAMCILLPHGVSTGNMSDFNYSSGRLVNQIYHRSLEVDQVELEEDALDRIFDAWLDEAARTTDLVPGGYARMEDWPHCWLWDGVEHVDPKKEADAQDVRLKNFTTTWTDECQRDGEDPETRMRKIENDLERWKRLEKYNVPNPYQPAVPAAATPTPKPGGTPNAGQQKAAADGMNGNGVFTHHNGDRKN